MYNRLLFDRNGYTQKILNRVNQFDEVVCRQPKLQSGKKYRCLCDKCKNRMYITPDELKMHLMYKGFVEE